MAFLVKKISFRDTYTIRSKVLRIGLPIESCCFDGDNLKSTLHFGCFENNKLVGVASLYEKKSIEEFEMYKQFQLRGMAVLQDYQKKGIGKMLVNYIEKELKNSEYTIIWFNARKLAVDFYKKLDYNIIGDLFEIVGVGSHYFMFKKI